MLWVWHNLGSAIGPVAVGVARPTALAAYVALLIVMSAVDELSLAWPVMGSLVLAAMVRVCASRDYGTRGWRLPVGSGIVGCGVALAATGVKLILHPAVRQDGGLLCVALFLSLMGVGFMAMGVALLVNRPTAAAGSAIVVYAFVTACGVVGMEVLGQAVGLAVAAIGLASIAALVPQLLRRRRGARIGMIGCGVVVLAVGVGLLITQDVPVGATVVIGGSLQAIAGVVLLFGRLIEFTVVVLGLVWVAGGVVALVLVDWPSYRLAVIGIGVALAVHGVSRHLPVLARRLSLSLTALA